MAFDSNIAYNNLPLLPPQIEEATKGILLEHVLKAARSLAELKDL